jgi:hypothetical protein
MFNGQSQPACLDSPADKKAYNKPIKLWPCHNMGGNQVRFRSVFHLFSFFFCAARTSDQMQASSVLFIVHPRIAQ